MNLFKIFPWFFGIVLFLVVATFAAQFYVAITVVSAVADEDSREHVAREVGDLYRAFQEGNE